MNMPRENDQLIGILPRSYTTPLSIHTQFSTNCKQSRFYLPSCRVWNLSSMHYVEIVSSDIPQSNLSQDWKKYWKLGKIFFSRSYFTPALLMHANGMRRGMQGCSIFDCGRGDGNFSDPPPPHFFICDLAQIYTWRSRQRVRPSDVTWWTYTICCHLWRQFFTKYCRRPSVTNFWPLSQSRIFTKSLW